MSEAENTRRPQPPGGEERGAAEVADLAVKAATIYGIYKATHPPKPPEQQ
jgi:hypothetical protein